APGLDRAPGQAERGRRRPPAEVHSGPLRAFSRRSPGLMRLTPDQLEASRALEGSIRLVAGAGTGKTAVIAERFRRLVARGVPSESILVMTFSERAAAEMRG